ncbi:hypothetical protein [Heyndrickxia ginsengihumi]|uniref:hypothetical protein n=1 Tax=Heyndrickxia ginsengihumi TaxID=363870 RepID=UPI001269F4D1|nr:hypothetical protein [Heyndrickxia ginsengihumi]
MENRYHAKLERNFETLILTEIGPVSETFIWHLFNISKISKRLFKIRAMAWMVMANSLLM